MKKIFNVTLAVIVAMSLASCSNKKVKEDEMQASSEQALTVDDSDFVVDAEDKMTDMNETTPADATVVGTEGETVMEPAMEETPMTETSMAPVIADSEYYEVQKGETLMWIAFKLYGDYTKWKELESNNREALAHGVKPGMKLKYNPGMFVWNPKGLPHLIKTGETLATISNDKYGTIRKWRSIWDNNRDMIKNPDLIFAGFTLYYVPEERELASEAQ